MRLQTVVRVVKYEADKQFYLNKKQDWVAFEKHVFVEENLLEIDRHDVEIIQDNTTILDTKALVDQKEKDKNRHIESLNNIITQLINRGCLE
jgi:lipopolysaccharide export LptBFGC system permease protein LptF